MCFLMIICLFGLKSHAQLTVFPSLTPTQLAALIAGPGVTISNATYTGQPIASGSFNALGTNLGLNSGIVLTTGNADQSIGPNNSDSSTTSLGDPGDLDLESLTGVQTFDASILEFDFIPQSDTITFRYVFASEEYPEYVCSEFNDLFGFFISGPGIVGKKNIALIPGTALPVAINSINNGSIGNAVAGNISSNCGLLYPIYYVDNTGGTTIQYDGFTTVLTAEIVVTRCQTYHLKIAIADGGDDQYNSGVFLEEGSLRSTPKVTAGNDISACVTANSIIGGLASPGWNYSWSPAVGLSNPLISNPLINLTNSTSSPVNITYVVSADSGASCILHDTVVVTINPFPTSPYTITNNSGCSGDTLQIKYTGNSSASATYSWNFAGATILTGSGQGPYSLTYPSAGSFPISLTVSQSGCVSSSTNQIVPIKTSPQIGFTIPPIVCQNDIINVSYTGAYNSPTANYVWNFGSSNILSGSGKGPYQIKVLGAGNTNYSLTVADSGCSTTSKNLIQINVLPIASINTISDFCTGDTININYNGSSSVNSIFTWNFGSGNLVSGSGIGPYKLTWQNQTIDSVSVIINENGCRDTTYTPINAFQKPIASINVTPSVCILADATISFNGIAASGSNYTWSLNNPTFQQGIGVGPITANWNSSGKKVINLTVNNHGCIANDTDTITVLQNPIASVRSLSTICNIDTLLISFNGTAGSGSVFNWNFGNAIPISGSGAGPYNLKWNSQQKDSIQLIVIDNGCSDTTFKNINIYQQPIAAISSPISLCEKQEGIISFSGNAIVGSLFNWSLSNPNSQVGNGPITTSWNTSGVKNIKVTVSNNGCIDTASTNIIINPTPIAKFSTNNVCDGIPVLFFDSSIVNGSSINNNSWDFGDGQKVNNIATPIHLFSKDTTYTVQLIAESIEGCKDTLSRLVTVYEKPIANFTSDTICQGAITHLNDLSKINSSSLSNWNWTLGDGDSSLANNPVHKYATAGDFNASLIVTTQQGCKDTISNPIKVWYLPNVLFTPNYLQGCEPLITNFQNNSSSIDGNIDSHQWEFGDGTIDTLSNPKHIYNAPGIYSVSLNITSDLGCSNDTTINNCVKVFPKPEASFDFSPSDPDILNPKVFFTNNSTYNDINRWLFSDGKISNVENPTHTFLNADTYPITLYVTSNDGCKDTANEIVVIKNSFTLYIPNAFSPNADGVNDEFQIKGYGINTFELQIFDRWGKLVYVSDSMNKLWKGEANGKDAPEDTYVYLIHVADVLGNDHDFKGRISIIR